MQKGEQKMTPGECVYYKNEIWYEQLSEKGKGVADCVIRYHNYFSSQDKKYRRYVVVLKITILILALANTIILGLNIIDNNIQVNVGLVLSALITFFTAVSSYFNFEEYWMRNIGIHIRLNIIRDNFILDAKTKALSDERAEYYKEELNKIQEGNIKYWKKAIRKLR